MMFCKQCGNQMQDGTTFCTACGAVQQEQPAEPVAAPAQTYAAPAETYAAPAAVSTNWQNSYFDGGLLGLIGVNLVVWFVSLITFGLAWPALWCYRLRWIYKHTVVGGYRLKFNGKGGQLFGKFLLWVLLTIVTLTIYAWWLPIKYKKWETSHIEIDSMIPEIG